MPSGTAADHAGSPPGYDASVNDGPDRGATGRTRLGNPTNGNAPRPPGACRVLMIGDLIGKPGRVAVEGLLGELRDERGIDFVTATRPGLPIRSPIIRTRQAPGGRGALPLVGLPRRVRPVEPVQVRRSRSHRSRAASDPVRGRPGRD